MHCFTCFTWFTWFTWFTGLPAGSPGSPGALLHLVHLVHCMLHLVHLVHCFTWFNSSPGSLGALVHLAHLVRWFMLSWMLKLCTWSVHGYYGQVDLLPLWSHKQVSKANLVGFSVPFVFLLITKVASQYCSFKVQVQSMLCAEGDRLEWKCTIPTLGYLLDATL